MLSRWTGQDDLVIGSPVAGRNRLETENLIGFFVNTLALRGDLAGDPTLAELLERLRETMIQAYAHEDLPFEKLVEELQPERSLSHSPIFQVVLVLQNAPMSSLELPGLTLEPQTAEAGTTKFDLTVSINESPGGLYGFWEYDSDLFDATTIHRLQGHFAILESLDRELNYAARLRQSLTCILLDIDHFKKVNDTYGHQAGDAVLRAIANALQQEIRRYDVLARYGGEEFVILLRATALDNALLLAERLRRLSSELEFVFDQKNASVTVSLGVASFDPDNPKSGDDLVREADRYLYEAKERGRNRVCSKRTQGTIPDKDSSNSQ